MKLQESFTSKSIQGKTRKSINDATLRRSIDVIDILIVWVSW